MTKMLNITSDSIQDYLNEKGVEVLHEIAETAFITEFDVINSGSRIAELYDFVVSSEEVPCRETALLYYYFILTLKFPQEDFELNQNILGKLLEEYGFSAIAYHLIDLEQLQTFQFFKNEYLKYKQNKQNIATVLTDALHDFEESNVLESFATELKKFQAIMQEKGIE